MLPPRLVLRVYTCPFKAWQASRLLAITGYMFTTPSVRLRHVAACVYLLAFAGNASANAGVPMLALTLPAMVAALIPVIAIEAVVLGRALKTSMVSRLKSVSLANAVSTVAGMPFTWCCLVGLQGMTGGTTAHGIATPAQKLLAVTWQAPWLIPYEGELHWMAPAASLVLLAPFFFASYVIEANMISRLEPHYPEARLKPAVFRANLFSYVLLAVANLTWLLWSLHQGA